MPKPSGVEMAGVLMILLGVDLSAKVMKHLAEKEIEQVSQQISLLENVSDEIQTVALREFIELAQARRIILYGGHKYTREVLEKALGHQRAEEVLNRVMVDLKSVPFGSLRRTDARQLFGFIRNEHPQTIALVLTHLLPEQAALILSSLPPEKQSDIARRVAVTEQVSPEAVREVEGVLEKKISMIVQQEESVGGLKTLVNILNRVDRSTEKTILEELEVSSPDLADEVRKQMFVFEDIVRLHDTAIQRVLREVDTKDLAKAMRGTNEEVNDRIYKNMSKRASDILRDEIQYMGPIRLREVEEAQQRIVQIIRRLDETGEIIIARGGEDAILI